MTNISGNINYKNTSMLHTTMYQQQKKTKKEKFANY